MVFYNDEIRMSYEVTDKGAIITDSDKKISEAVIPANIDGNPVVGIQKKAFLGCKDLRFVSIPGSVKSIGEWAFAYCDNLKSIVLRRGLIELGKGVFKNDERLKEIVVAENDFTSLSEADSDTVMTANLMASTPVIMDAEFLIDTVNAGSDEWLRKWDTKLSHVLTQRDDDGYHLYVLCGEEDLHFDYDEYMEYNRERKSALCMLRLVNNIGLNNSSRSEYIEYLLDHTKGMESEAAFKALLNRHGDDREYYELMLEIEAINSNNLEEVLLAMGDRHAEMKAFLIESCGREESNDFFDDLLL